ncbi:RNA polymerase subunit sigma [Jeotgalibacillus salarius]|uniref:RNA polymerase subunit sigma n=1 Tax=Jeotgalibacillus salarius TaxID=546023 RepID=A0A4Y8LLD2_9BACL|nr:RNA polymerase subunit sigma [Jeotgalibacillus salarius]TFE02783.1 RNA polymerase subunit sigma [Jeotgalibacillus salarius]
MSLKLIELQVAIPKTVDAGKLADQQQQQSAINQSQMAALAEKERLRKMESVNRFGESEKTKDKRDRERNEQSETPENQHVEENMTMIETQSHPFKGRRVDFSG